MKKNDEGFTLVELLIVIVILGILATVVVFAVQGITDTGQQNACAVGERTVQTAVEAYYAENQAWPASMADLSDFLREDTGDWSIGSNGAGNVVSGSDCDGVSF